MKSISGSILCMLMLINALMVVSSDVQSASSYAIIAAQNAGGGDLGQLVALITAACWAGDENVAEDEVVRRCLSESGFDPALADSGMLSGAETYARNLEEAVQKGVFGAPFFITDDDQRFWGQDRLHDLDLHLSGKI